jgi:hypothetical protein
LQLQLFDDLEEAPPSPRSTTSVMSTATATGEPDLPLAEAVIPAYSFAHKCTTEVKDEWFSLRPARNNTTITSVTGQIRIAFFAIPFAEPQVCSRAHERWPRGQRRGFGDNRTKHCFAHTPLAGRRSSASRQYL